MVIERQIYHWKNLFPGSKAILTKDKCMTRVPLRILKMWIFAWANVDTRSHFYSCGAGRCWMLLVPSDICSRFWASLLVSVFLLFYHSACPTLFRAWQLEPLLRVPSAGDHSPRGRPWPTRTGTEMRKPSFFPWKSTNAGVWFRPSRSWGSAGNHSFT